MNDQQKKKKDHPKRKPPFLFTSFGQQVLNNRYITTIIVLILISLLILLVTKINYLFIPVIEFIKIVMMPIIFAGVLYYLTVPIVNYLEKKNVKRHWSAWIVLLILLLLIVWLASTVPSLIREGKNLIQNWASIWEQYQTRIDHFISADWIDFAQNYVDEFIVQLQNINLDWGGLANTTLSSIGTVFGKITKIAISLITAPIILFYMLIDSGKFKSNIARAVPTKWRKTTMNLLSDMNNQISGYIRGQILVAIAVAIMFVIGYAIIGLEYGTVIGVAAGLLNIIPYVGSFLGMIPAMIVGIVYSPMMFVKVLLVFAVEQTIESRVISPLILGSNLNIHPVTIMLLLISGGDMFGILGIIFVIPVYAVIKVVVIYLFNWYRRISGLYEEEELLEDNRGTFTEGESEE